MVNDETSSSVSIVNHVISCSNSVDFSTNRSRRDIFSGIIYEKNNIFYSFTSKAFISCKRITFFVMVSCLNLCLKIIVQKKVLVL